MTDTTAFERQLSGEIEGLMGPVRPVDDLAIADAVLAATGSPRWRFWSTSTPSAYGGTPIVNRRTRIMFSPVKAIIAGALVFALGGLYLVAGPIDQPKTAVPGAEVTEAPLAVSVGSACGNVLAVPVVCTWTASDPRLTGSMTHEWIRPKVVDGQITADLSDDGVRVGWADAAVEGPEGDWIGYQYAVWSDDPTQLFILLSGQGAYEGWHFVASTVDPGTPGDSDWTGVMYQGEPPPLGPPVDLAGT